MATMNDANLTPYPEINALLEVLLSNFQQILDKRIVAVYLYGSLVTGDFDLESSDIDLVVVTSADIDDQVLDRLRQMHHDFAQQNKRWDDRIEVVYVSVAALKTFRLHTSKIAVISPGEPLHVKEAGKDWLMNWYVVRENGLTLFGSSPETIIEPISKQEFVHAVEEYAQSCAERLYQIPKRRPAQAYLILTMCRALYTHTNARQISKKQAAIWAMNQLPEWSSLIQRALMWRATWRDEAVDDQVSFSETERFVQAIIRRIKPA
jgi:hypothetical protein